MIFEEQHIAGVYKITLVPRADDRGWFARAFCKQLFAEQGIEFDIT